MKRKTTTERKFNVEVTVDAEGDKRLISLRRGLMVCTGIKGSSALNKTWYNIASNCKRDHKA